MNNLAQKIKKNIKKVETIVQPIDFNNGIVCIRMDYAGGFMYNSNNGYNVSQNEKETTFQEIVETGNTEIIMLWKNSLESVVSNVRSYEFENETLPRNYVDSNKIIFKIGAYALGNGVSENSDINITQEATYNDFTTIINKESFTLTFTEQNFYNGFDFEDLKTSLFCFPFNRGFKMYKAKVERKIYFNTNSYSENGEYGQAKTFSYEVDFTEITNELQKSGVALETYINLASPGGGFPWPKLDYDFINNKPKIVLDDVLIKNTGINTIQESFYNASIQSSTVFYGWEIVEEEGPDMLGRITQPKLNPETGNYELNLYNPSLILPVNFTNTERNIITKSSNPVNNFIYIDEMNFDYTAYANWKDHSISQITGDYDTKYEGELHFNAAHAINDGSYTLNDTTSLTKLKQLTYEFFDIPTTTYIKRATMNTGTQIGTFVTNWETINLYNFYYSNNIISLPFSFTEHINKSLENIPIIGGVANTVYNTFSGGVPYKWTEQIITKTSSNDKINLNISGLIPSSFFNFSLIDLSLDTTKPNNSYILLNRFNKQNGDKLRADNLTMSFKYELTNQILMNGAGNPHNTSSLELQTDDGDNHYNYYFNTNINKWSKTGHDYNLISKTNFYSPLRNETNNNRKFVLCAYVNKNFGAQAIKLTALLDNQSKYNTTINTMSNLTDNSREWTNIITMNYFNQTHFNGDHIQFPLQIDFNPPSNSDIAMFSPVQKIENTINKTIDEGYQIDKNGTGNYQGIISGSKYWWEINNAMLNERKITSYKMFDNYYYFQTLGQNFLSDGQNIYKGIFYNVNWSTMTEDEIKDDFVNNYFSKIIFSGNYKLISRSYEAPHNRSTDGQPRLNYNDGKWIDYRFEIDIRKDGLKTFNTETNSNRTLQFTNGAGDNVLPPYPPKDQEINTVTSTTEGFLLTTGIIANVETSMKLDSNRNLVIEIKAVDKTYNWIENNNTVYSNSGTVYCYINWGVKNTEKYLKKGYWIQAHQRHSGLADHFYNCNILKLDANIKLTTK